MPKTHYRTVWISDAHLCTRDCRVECLLSFLNHVKCDNLYVIGDFLDLWQMKRRWYWPQSINDVIRKVLSKARKGANVIFIPGNHDELFRDYSGIQFGGVKILTEAVHVTADGRRLLVLHGDEFDVVVQYRRWLALLGSAAYDYLIYLNRVFNFVRRRFGMPYWSLSAYIKGRVKHAVKYVGRFEEAAVHEARRRNLHGVICGHIHQPIIRELDGMLYCNSGDWVENCTALVETHEGELQILRWPDDMDKIRVSGIAVQRNSNSELLQREDAENAEGIGMKDSKCFRISASLPRSFSFPTRN